LRCTDPVGSAAQRYAQSYKSELFAFFAEGEEGQACAMHSLRERCKLLVEGKSATRAERGPVQLTRRVLDAKVLSKITLLFLKTSEVSG
jgi:hypothetical protein